MSMTYLHLKNDLEQVCLEQASLEQTRLEQTALESISHKLANPTNLLFKQTAPLLLIATLVIGWVMIEPTFGVTVQSLQAPIQNLKSTIFGGWMWIAKIGAAVGGCVMAVYQRDIIPLATGAAVGLGIHFYDGYFGDVTNAALI